MQFLHLLKSRSREIFLFFLNYIEVICLFVTFKVCAYFMSMVAMAIVMEDIRTIGEHIHTFLPWQQGKLNVSLLQLHIPGPNKC